LLPGRVSGAVQIGQFPGVRLRKRRSAAGAVLLETERLVLRHFTDVEYALSKDEWEQQNGITSR
jgi:hypothetical protein